ncbi:hypothetical protein DCAR_0101523 [Daucus carota subsp. sativus]|uniref:Uncharacterized protein n=1 Tax=Daucus carota subsp. sativus TaxID=79200 RepID=A0AAF0W4T6_DAUCS|nr:hypothetical protein DCAR_0101523 [Daucus carota subsp. sativus]
MTILKVEVTSTYPVSNKISRIFLISQHKI